MSIISIKSEMLLPVREFVINKNLSIREKPVLIASITEQDGVDKLWVFQQVPDNPFTDVDDAKHRDCMTNRDNILKRASYARHNYADFSAITIQGTDLPISQSSSGIIGRDPAGYMKLQHFMEAGVDFTSIEEVSFDELVLGGYQVQDGFGFPKINAEMDITVALNTRNESFEMLLEPSHRFCLEMGDQDISRSFRDPATDNEIKYYISCASRQDIWGETLKQMQDENTFKIWREQGLDETAIEQALSTWQESVEKICPKGHELLVLEYECSDNRQLNFYTTEYLDSIPENTGSSTAVFLFGSAKKKSRHGHDVRSCLLKTVPAGFDEAVEVELMSCYSSIPGETFEA